MTLAAVDLNLVIALHALLEERSVTRAARRVGLSQPAMSHALARLRAHYGDPLLIRSGRAMILSARATSMLADARRTVGALTHLLDTRAFDPAEVVTDLRIVTDDWLGATVLPRLVARIAAEAPRIDIDVLPRGAPGRKALLRRGAADLALGHFSGAGMDLHRQPLFDDGWATVLREGHPALASPLTPAAWAALPHVLVAPTGGRRGEVDLILQAEGLARRVGFAVPHFHTALAVVAATDCVATVPRTVVPRGLGVVAVDPPLPLPPIAVSMCWHARSEPDPVQQWVRRVVVELAGG